MNHHATSLLYALRHARRVTGTISVVVAIAFTMLILAPTAQAVQVELNQDADSIALSPAAEFAAQMVELGERLKHWRAALQPETLTPVAEAQRGRNELRTIRARLAELDIAVRQDMTQKLQALQQRSAANLMIDRQQEIITGYTENFNQFLRLLDNLADQPANSELAALDAAIAFMDEHPSQRQQRPFDPNELPTQNLQPLPDNLPMTSIAEFQAADLATDSAVPESSTQADASSDQTTGTNISQNGQAQNGPATFDDPQWLAATDEVVLSEAIQAKAAELDHDPVKIYHWVRNTIDWLPSWGAQQDAEITLGSRRGNAFDQASLLIALLRASAIPARYVHGTIDVDAETFRNWTGGFDDINSALALASAAGIPLIGLSSGGQISKVRLEHIWVEAGLDYEPSRAARHMVPDNWVPMDPSFKQYEFLEGLDPIAISGLDAEQLAEDFVDSGTVNEDESWVTGFDPQILQDAQQQLQDALAQFIEDNINDPTVGDVIGGRKVIVQEYPIVPSGLPYEVFVAGSRLAQIPAPLQQTITLGFGVGIDGLPINPMTIPWAKVNNHKLTLSFTPASETDAQALANLIPEDATSIDDLPSSLPGTIRVLPELKLDGELIHSGTASLRLGSEFSLANQVFFPGRGSISRPLSVITGSFLTIGSESGSISSLNLEQLRSKIEQTKTILETQDPAQLALLGREDLLGDLFHAGMLGYYAQLTALGNLMGLQQDGQMMLQAGMGLHGYEPRVTTLFGLPIAIRAGGVIFDLPIVRAVLVDGLDQAQNAQFSQQIGLLGSALEHAVPEQMFTTDEQPGEAISAVKALSKANAEGQRIYQLTQDNMADTLPNLNLAFETEAEIRSALNAGMTVIAHTDNVSVPGWSGAGYIIFDPVTGSGAYKIAGGANGGFILLLGFIFIAIFLNIAATVLIIGLLTETAATIQIVAGALAFYAAIQQIERAFDECSEAFTAAALSILFVSVALLNLIGDIITTIISLVVDFSLDLFIDVDEIPLNC